MTAQTEIAGVIAPPPLIALGVLVLGLALDWLWPLPFLRNLLGLPARLAIAGLAVALGLGIAVVAERTFHRLGTHALPWKPALQLASTGIYAHTRNPMYLGLGLLVLGIGLALGSVGTLLMLVPGALVLHHGVVLREERYLERKFGDDYRRFKSEVPRYGWRW
ncbi:MAG: isoprenylcysteine carboxylmethyltransferase family protein [Xanthobacteraceae bacterium]